MPFRGPEGPRSEPFVAGLDALDGPVLRLAKYTPTATLVRLGGWDKYTLSIFWEGVLASTGHRGRVDARGPPPHAPAGLTRTSGQCAGAPSRDGRGRSPSASRWGARRARGARDARETRETRVSSRARPRTPTDSIEEVQAPAPQAPARRSREGAPTRWPDVRVKPGALPERWPRASARPRWPADAKTPLKNGQPVFVPTTEASQRRGGRVFGETENRAVEGIEPRHERPRARPLGSPKRHSSERPRNEAVQADFRRPFAVEPNARPPRRNAGSPKSAKRAAPQTQRRATRPASRARSETRPKASKANKARGVQKHPPRKQRSKGQSDTFTQS